MSEFGEGVFDVVDGGGECRVSVGTEEVAGTAGEGVGMRMSARVGCAFL